MPLGEGGGVSWVPCSVVEYNAHSDLYAVVLKGQPGTGSGGAAADGEGQDGAGREEEAPTLWLPRVKVSEAAIAWQAQACAQRRQTPDAGLAGQYVDQQRAAAGRRKLPGAGQPYLAPDAARDHGAQDCASPRKIHSRRATRDFWSRHRSQFQSRPACECCGAARGLLQVCFGAEDPAVFARRHAEAHRSRARAESLLRYNLYIDSMPTEDIPPLTNEQVGQWHSPTRPHSIAFARCTAVHPKPNSAGLRVLALRG